MQKLSPECGVKDFRGPPEARLCRVMVRHRAEFKLCSMVPILEIGECKAHFIHLF